MNIYRIKLDITKPKDQKIAQLILLRDEFIHEGFDNDQKLNVFATSNKEVYETFIHEYEKDEDQITWFERDVWEVAIRSIAYNNGKDPLTPDTISEEEINTVNYILNRIKKDKIQQNNYGIY